MPVLHSILAEFVLTNALLTWAGGILIIVFILPNLLVYPSSIILFVASSSK
jgi:hypothetical protein